MTTFIIISFLLFFIAIGIYFGRGNTTASEYFKGSESTPWVVAMFSIVATETSVLTFVSVPSISYRGDWWFLQLGFGYLIGRVLVSYILLPKYFSDDIVSIYEVIGKYYGRAVQRFSSSVFLLTRLLADGIRFLATAIVFDVLTGWGIVLSVLVIGFVTLLYSSFGGFRSIVWIDSIQFLIYLLGGVVSLYYLFSFLGNQAALEALFNSDRTSIFHFGGSILYQSNLFINGLIGGTFLSFASHGVDYMMVQRSLSCHDLGSARKAMIGSGFLVILQFMIFLCVGTLLYTFFNGIGDLSLMSEKFIEQGQVKKDRELSLFVTYYLPPALRAFLLVGVMSAAMSTLSSSINSLSSSTVRDLFGINDDIWISRAVSVFWAFVLIAIALMFDESNTLLVITGLKIASFTYGILLSLFLMYLTKLKPQNWVIVFSAILGVVTVFALQDLGISWTWFILASTAVNYLVALFVTKYAQRGV